MDLDQTPSLSPPTGATSNLKDPYVARGTYLAVQTICLVAATLCFWMRAYTVFRINKSHGWADYTAFFAWLGLVIYCSLQFGVNHSGNGTHLWNVSVAVFEVYLQDVNAVEIVYGPVLFVTKLSLLLQYRRIFVPFRQGAAYWLIVFLIWLNFLFYLADFFVTIFQCLPRRKIYDPTVPGTCVDIKVELIVAAVINMVLDFCILILPLVGIWRLHLPARLKIAPSLVFLAGTFACVASIMRLVESIKLTHTLDITWVQTRVELWSDAEITSGIVCGSLVVSPRFFRHFFPTQGSKRLSNNLSGPKEHSDRATLVNDPSVLLPQYYRADLGDRKSVCVELNNRERSEGSATSSSHGDEDRDAMPMP